MCVCVLSLVRVDFRPKINYVFFSSGADARRYFSLFLLLHNGFFFVFSSGIVWANITACFFALSKPTTSRVGCLSTSLLDFKLFSFFRFHKKSVFFGAYELLIVHIIHCKLSSKLNYFSSSNGRGVQNFASVAATTFSFFQSESTFNALFC